MNSLWVSTLIGTSSWRTRADAVRDVPTLVAGGVPFHSSSATWVAPGWAVVTYNVSASRVSPLGKLRIGLGVNRENGNIVAWNGDSHMRWVLVSLHSGVGLGDRSTAERWHGPVTLSEPDAIVVVPAAWSRRLFREVALKPRTQRSVSPRRASAASMPPSSPPEVSTWPSSGRGLDDTDLPRLLLSALGVVDVTRAPGWRRAWCLADATRGLRETWQIRVGFRIGQLNAQRTRKANQRPRPAGVRSVRDGHTLSA